LEFAKFNNFGGFNFLSFSKNPFFATFNLAGFGLFFRQFQPFFGCPNTDPSKDARLGAYDVGDADFITICSPMLMMHSFASEVFEYPNEYNPTRFMESRDGGDGKVNRKHILNWGGGVHGFPGKTYAINEIKVAVAYLINYFDIQVTPNPGGDNFYAPTVLSNRNAGIRLRLR